MDWIPDKRFRVWPFPVTLRSIFPATKGLLFLLPCKYENKKTDRNVYFTMMKRLNEEILRFAQNDRRGATKGLLACHSGIYFSSFLQFFLSFLWFFLSFTRFFVSYLWLSCHTYDFSCHSRFRGNPDFLLYHLMKMEIQNTKGSSIFIPHAKCVKIIPPYI